ncbi:MAG: glyoxalase [Acidimicrobiia bacterium]|nr:glyoxalase [Acidimicrobiia bacterium]
MGATVIPILRYRDAAAAIRFLADAFGFEAALVVEGQDETIEHAQLRFGSGMVMVGTARDDEFGRLVGGSDRPIRGSIYVIVDDVDAHAEHARAAGAEIIMEPTAQDYGGSDYVAADPEGNIWSFGSYDPWAAG